MGLLREILVESFLLREDASVTAVNDAVRNMRPVRITYNGPSGTGKGEREIYPVAYGISTAGNPVVRAFQPQGSTSTEVPSWKFFRLDRVTSWQNDNSRTFDPKDLNGFNDKGDEQIETLYAVSPIGGATAERQPGREEKPEKIVTGHPVRKGEVDNGGADKNTEKTYYTANDAVNDVLRTANPMVGMTNDKNIQKNIDKVAGQDDNSMETQPVRDAVPVSKTEVDPDAAYEPEKVDQSLNRDDGPVMKTDVAPERDTTLAGTFRDMTNRMDSLNKDEEEEENI